MKNIICLDTETTGLDREKDEILQLSIIDGNGNVLFDNLIKPSHRRSWAKAQNIHGISPADVSKCNTLFYYKSEIERILQSADIIVGYNIMGFDLPMLFNNGIKNEFKSGTVICDVMKEYALINGEWNEYSGDWKFKKLIDCAEYYKYPGNNWHNAMDDAQATLFCFYAMCGNPPDLSHMIVGKHMCEDNPPESNPYSDSSAATSSDPIADSSSEPVVVDIGNPKYNTGLYSFTRFLLIFLGIPMLLAGIAALTQSFIGGVIGCVISFLMLHTAHKYRRIIKARRASKR